MNINEIRFRRNKSEMCCFDEKENDERVVLSTSQSDMETKVCQSVAWEQNLGIAIFKKIQVWKIFIQPSYHYDWMVTDIM